MKIRIKKTAAIIFMIFLLTACGKPGRPIVLPAGEEVISISVSDGERTGYSPDAEGEADEFISDFFNVLADMEITNKESITDAPANVDYITIDLNCEDKTTTLFYYKDKGTEYVEQPYQGIYKPDAALGLYIMEMLDAADNTKETVTFQATIIESSNDAILVKPVDGSLELNSADKFSILNEEKHELQVGDLIEVVYNGEIMETYPAQLGEVYEITVVERAGADAMWDRIPMVRVNGKLYYDTGRESGETGRCGTMDGEITSTVDGTEIPMEDDQSNFGSGFGYQYGKDGTIEIYMNEKWMIFEYRDE